MIRAEIEPQHADPARGEPFGDVPGRNAILRALKQCVNKRVTTHDTGRQFETRSELVADCR
jgi:hypothetical protein